MEKPMKIKIQVELAFETAWFLQSCVKIFEYVNNFKVIEREPETKSSPPFLCHIFVSFTEKELYTKSCGILSDFTKV